MLSISTAKLSVSMIFNCFFLEISILAIKNIGHDQSGRVSGKGLS